MDLLASQEKLCRAVDVLVGVAVQAAREQRLVRASAFTSLPLEVLADRVDCAPARATESDDRAVCERRLDGGDLVRPTGTVGKNALQDGVEVVGVDADRTQLLRHSGEHLGVLGRVLEGVLRLGELLRRVTDVLDRPAVLRVLAERTQAQLVHAQPAKRHEADFDRLAEVVRRPQNHVQVVRVGNPVDLDVHVLEAIELDDHEALLAVAERPGRDEARADAVHEGEGLAVLDDLVSRGDDGEEVVGVLADDGLPVGDGLRRLAGAVADGAELDVEVDPTQLRGFGGGDLGRVDHGADLHPRQLPGAEGDIAGGVREFGGGLRDLGGVLERGGHFRLPLLGSCCRAKTTVSHPRDDVN